MKVEKNLEKASILEMVKISLFGLVIFNFLLIILFTLTPNTTYLEQFQKLWVLFVLAPIFQGIIQANMNRNAILTVEEITDRESLKKTIGKIVNDYEYKELYSDRNQTIYNKKAKWKRILNRIFGGRVILKVNEETVEIFGKNTMLSEIEKRIG